MASVVGQVQACLTVQIPTMRTDIVKCCMMFIPQQQKHSQGEKVKIMSSHTTRAFSADDDFDLSNRQEKKLDNQLANAIKMSGIVQIGESRHDLKQNAYENGCRTSHEVNQSIGLTSYASYHKFQSQIKVFSGWCFSTQGINNINQIKPEHITGFIHDLCDRDYAKNTIQGYAAALNKYAVVLDKACPSKESRLDSWNNAISECRESIGNAISKDLDTRAYTEPKALVEALPEGNLKLIATLQLDYGLRIADATKINVKNLSSEGVLTVPNSKNGQTLQIQLAPADAQKIKDLADADGRIHVQQSVYRSALSKACADTGQTYNGSHGLRHNYAQSRMSDLVDQGKDYHAALQIVSDEMGHHRPDITATYLR